MSTQETVCNWTAMYPRGTSPWRLLGIFMGRSYLLIWGSRQQKLVTGLASWRSRLSWQPTVGTTRAQPRTLQEQPAIQPWSMWTVHTLSASHTVSSFNLIISKVSTALTALLCNMWINHSSVLKVVVGAGQVLAMIAVVYIAVSSYMSQLNVSCREMDCPDDGFSCSSCTCWHSNVEHTWHLPSKSPWLS
jgi:hypothetical protein